MKLWSAVSAAVLLASSCLAATPTERLAQQSQLAQALAAKHAYSDAATVLATLAHDPDITGLPGWPDAVYDLARDEAASGQSEQAMAALHQAVEFGATPDADTVAGETAFAPLAKDARFKAELERLKKAAALWQDNAAIATPFKPVLSEEEKAAGVSKLWSEAKFNFAFFGRVPDLDWDGEYVKALREAHAAQTTEAYYGVLARFVALLKDGHTRVVAPPQLSDRLYAEAPVTTALIDGKIIVTGVSDPAVAIARGSELVTINGEPAFAYAARAVAPSVFGFTEQDRNAWQYGYQLLRGPVDQPVTLGLRLANGRLVSTNVSRHHNTGMVGYAPAFVASEFKLIGDVAYLRVGTMFTDEGAKLMRAHAAEIGAAKGLVIDVRDNGGGNSSNGLLLLQMMADKPFETYRYSTREYIAAYRSWGHVPGWHREAAGLVAPDSALHIGGKVVVLVGAKTYSSAEDFVAGFKVMKRGTIVGQTTGGSTGNPINMTLPGGGLAMICSKEDTYPDGSKFVGVGVLPDVAVKPSIADVRAGRDHELETAIRLLTK
jgi:C-terminal processing protease CtpA/Prc